jgi:PAS domain S-box-containing protein
MASDADPVAARLAAIVESSDDAIVSKDLNGVIKSWNEAAERMFGYSAAEAVGRNIRLIIPPDRHAEEELVLERIRRGDRVDHYETVRLHKDGRSIDISLTVSPIKMEDGRVIGASKIAHDITEAKRLRRELQEANRLKDEFLATLSHELRTPLNALLGYARILKTDALEGDRRRQAVAIIERNAVALAQLVSDVLDVSRITAGKFRLDVQACDVPTIVEHALDAVRPAIEAKDLRVERIIDPEPGPVWGDPDRLQQLFWNLLSNAAKFTPKRGRIQICVRRTDSRVEFVVSDTGIGIAPEFLPHLFQKFRQADSSVSREFSGLGLGLALTRYIVELHGGEVSAASEGPGKGATFRVLLPVMIAQGEPAQSEVGAKKTPQRDRRLTGVVVLAVDDDADSLLLLSDILHAAGATVVCATSAAQALEILDRHLPHVVVVDIGMPGMDGYAFIRAVRQRDHRQGGAIPAAALTAYARSEDRTAALRAGFQIHLAKPIDPEELLASIAALTGHSRLTGAVS